MTNTILTFTLALAVAIPAFGQAGNSNSIEAQLNELRIQKTQTLSAFSLMAAHARSRVSWESHLENLDNIKVSVNRSAAIIRNLESKRDSMSAAQQARFDELQSQTANLASVTNTLIKRLKESGYVTMNPHFHNAVNEAYKNALGSRQAVRDLIAMGSQGSAMPAGN